MFADNVPSPERFARQVLFIDLPSQCERYQPIDDLDRQRTQTHRLILHNDGYDELYDHTSAASETRNVAEAYPTIVEELTAILQKRLE